ncbi:hypothetical protein EDC45_0411 [Mesocricetibacter intestinalis]|uniref:Integrase DNA-binding domain-containing protein n=1 Tax=Mesocricetibacter intestinalis TaxID=1521930 RepID=A0A4R6VFV3_9PAST|nr:integrase arm-type DNA-binding domain-containing protein [Mesocricetibacter intestinalis]TDQ59752.1 hypothetical protein EDC45_0411 [Mesocricetibacter intestinalis]
MPLTNTEIEKAKPKYKPYPLKDGGVLFLPIAITASNARQFNYLHPLSKQKFGIEAYPSISLVQAREKYKKYRTVLA